MSTEMFACSACAELMRLLKVAEALLATRADPDPALFQALQHAVDSVRHAMTIELDMAQ